MAELYEINENIEQVILVGVSTGQENTEESLDELAELAMTAGAQVVGRIIQNRESIHVGTYVGKGKLDEILELAEETGATGILCDDELSPAQLRNLSDTLDMKIMDRTLIILDIFAERALTSEGKIQVELAQLKYRSSRLVGMRKYLSRLGGGIGTKGPGEKKLEMDRRLIQDRIAQLGKELEEVKKHRNLVRSHREKSPIPVICIVGYTNAGKSTLLNTLTDAGIMAEDKLFATLDPTTRNFKLDSGQEVLLTDTVGFIRKLPHHLIEAFRSTLEEARYADLIVHVVDASNPQMEQKMNIVYETLKKLEVFNKICITAFNKMDKVTAKDIYKDTKADRVVMISANDRSSVSVLTEVVEELLREQKILIEKVFDYKDGGKVQEIRKYGQLLEEEYRDEGIYVKAYVDKSRKALI